MSTISYTHQGIILFLKELKIKLNKPARTLLAWLKEITSKCLRFIFTLSCSASLARRSLAFPETLSDASSFAKAREIGAPFQTQRFREYSPYDQGVLA